MYGKRVFRGKNKGDIEIFGFWSKIAMWLLIDDARDYGYLIARNGEIGLEVLRLLKGKIEGVMLDHDLGYGMSGYEVMFKAIEEDILPNEVQIVTSNPAGRKYMEQTLIANGYIRDGQNWRKTQQ